MILKQFSDVWLKRTIMLVPKDRDTKGAEYGPTQGQACLSGSIREASDPGLFSVCSA